VFIKTVATAHNFVSKCDSITVPTQFLSGFAFSSAISATSKIFSNKSSIQSHIFADTGTIITSPPQSSHTNPCSANCPFTWSGFAPCLSILFIATTTGIPASFAWFIDSIV
jgi:hypothetical protein